MIPLVLLLMAAGFVGVALAVVGLMWRDARRVERARQTSLRRLRDLNASPERSAGA